MKISFWISLSALFLLNACTEKITFDLNDSNIKVVIDGSITTEYKRHQVYITTSASYYDQQGYPRVAGAQVSISDGTNTFVLQQVADGYYLTDSLAGEVGKTYTLTVQYEGETYTASSLLKPVARLDSIAVVQLFDTIPILNKVDSSYSVGIAISEPVGLGDHYLFKYYINGILESDSVREYSFSDDAFIDGLTFTYPPIISVYQIDHTLVEPGDVVRLEVSSINKQYSDYLTAVLVQTEFRGTIFDGPATNVAGNISNGALGYFRAADVSTAETVIE